MHRQPGSGLHHLNQRHAGFLLVGDFRNADLRILVENPFEQIDHAISIKVIKAPGASPASLCERKDGVLPMGECLAVSGQQLDGGIAHHIDDTV